SPLIQDRGRLVKDRTKRPKLNCRNWECGVVIPIAVKSEIQPELRQECVESLSPPPSLNEKTICRGPVSMEIFRDRVPLPMQYPGEAYGSKTPWFFTKQGA